MKLEKVAMPRRLRYFYEYEDLHMIKKMDATTIVVKPKTKMKSHDTWKRIKGVWRLQPNHLGQTRVRPKRKHSHLFGIPLPESIKIR